MTPQSAAALKKLGYECLIEAGAGAAARFSDAAYAEAGATVVPDAAALWAEADVVAKVRAPTPEEVELAREGQIVISFVYPAQNPELLESLKARGVTAIAMDMVPRISRAQKMDALSSMANIAGYRAVIEAGENFGRFFTGQVTAAGKVPPAKVLVVGAGVAGLSAIGTATSLGAITYAFDVRPEVAEQIESMGAEFVYLDFEEAQADGAATGGYAAPSSPGVPREAAREVPRAGAGHRHRHHHGAHPRPPGAEALDQGHGRGDEARLGHRRPRRRAGRQLRPDQARQDLRDQERRAHRRLYRHGEPDGDPGLDALRQQHPPHDGRPDPGQGRRAGRQHGGRRHPRRHGHPRRRRHLPAAAAEDRGDRQAGAEAGRSRRPPRPRPRASSPALQKASTRTTVLLVVGTVLVLLVGTVAPVSFMQHFIVFALACFVGFYVIWNVSHALHTPLMAITNGISSIIILGALLQIGSGSVFVALLAALATLMASVNIFGGFLVTRRMLAMFQKS